MKAIFKRLIEISENKMSCVLGTIIRQAGSSPRGEGAKFLIMEDGSFEGTIGGGAVEAKALSEAEGVLKSGRSVRLNFHLDGTDVESTEMLCGGAVEVLLEPLDPAGPHVSVLKKALEVIGQGGSGILLTALDQDLSAGGFCPRLFIDKTGEKRGNLGLSEALEESLSGYLSGILETGQPGIISAPIGGGMGMEFFAEPVRGKPILFIFGAGHVARQVVPLAEKVGFKAFVLDDRPEFADGRFFGKQTEVRVVSYDCALEGINIHEDAFVVIVTRGHLGDKTVLAQVLKTDAGYIGMIGSAGKRDAIFGKLIEKGFSKNDLERVYCPIGIEIGADTPEEIAVSIVAELIKVRRG